MPCHSSDAQRSWSDYYDFDLTWRRHRSNVIGHWPLIRRILWPWPQSTLEVGTGTGSMSSFISYAVPRTTSIDIDAGVLRRARRNGALVHGRAQFVRGNAFALPYPDAAYDVAFSQGFFEHFTDEAIAALLREQLRVARKVAFSVPNATYATRDFGNERLLTRQAWDELLRRMGLPLVESLDYAPLRKRFWREPRVHYMAVLAARPPTLVSRSERR